MLNDIGNQMSEGLLRIQGLLLACKKPPCGNGYMYSYKVSLITILDLDDQ